MAETDEARPESDIEVRSFGEDIIVLSCTVAAHLRTPPKLETLTGAAPSPLASLRTTLENRSTHILWAFRRPVDRDLVFRAHAGLLGRTMLVEVQQRRRYPAIDFAALISKLESRSRVSLVSALLGVWSSAFKLRRSQSFVRAMRTVADALAPDAAIVTAETELADGQALFRTHLPEALGDVQAIYLLTPKAVVYIPRRWQLGTDVRGGRRTLHLVACADPRAAERFVIVGAGGVAIRRLAAQKTVPSLPDWWRAHARNGDQIREFIVRALADVSPAARAAALEFQVRTPLKPKVASGGSGLPSAAIELALTGPSGLLAAGWIRDPGNFAAGVEAFNEHDDALPLSCHHFPVVVAGKPATGFVGFTAAVRSAAPILQPRFRLAFLSGSHERLVPLPQPLDAVERRARALKAVPPQHLTDTVLETIAPALGDLQAAVRAELGEPRIEAIGEPLPSPACSVVIPLYRNMEFLNAQVAAFAADNELKSDAEVVYVLDSPWQAADVRQRLRGLNLLYGLPFTFVTMSRNGGYAAACNVGARSARGSCLVMLNSDVIPAKPGWLGLLTSRLGGTVGAAGPKLLFEDNSIQHAGLYFAQSHFGHWLNHHFHKGMPRAFAPANVERCVPAVTGACLVIKRTLFDEVGGFTEDYVIGDYEDSDLCLKLRRAGKEIVYVPSAELYHFERQSIRKNEDYMLGTADRYNAWLHASRWDAAMVDAMAGDRQAAFRSAA